MEILDYSFFCNYSKTKFLDYDYKGIAIPLLRILNIWQEVKFNEQKEKSGSSNITNSLQKTLL